MPVFLACWIRFLCVHRTTIPRCRVRHHSQGRLLKEHVIFDCFVRSKDVNNALGSPLHSPHGWLHYPIGKDQHSENRNILFPMPLWMRQLVEVLHRTEPCARVFPTVMTTKIGCCLRNR